MKHFLSVMLLGGAMALGATGLWAKPLSKIIREIGLTPGDFAMLSASGKSLYATGTPRPGRIVSWSNPESRSRGTAKLAAMRGNCAYVQHIVFPKGAETSREIRTRVCRDAQGKWQLQP